jgi:hypothetical protein
MKKTFVLACSILITVTGCNKVDDNKWIDIGSKGSMQWEDIHYRLISRESGGGPPATHVDLASLTMDLQSGKAVGAWVYIPVTSCLAPKVRNGVPSVLCYSRGNSDVIIGADDNIRAVLMGLEGKKKVAALVGRAVGTFGGDTPVVLVEDPTVGK